jgi:O-antigen/teichoic acid export membrane protein
MRQLIVYSALYGGTAVFQKLVGFLIFMYLARLLTVEEYAQFGLLYALQQGLATLASAGVVEAAVGQLRGHGEPAQRTRLFASANLVFLVLVVVGCGAALLARPAVQQLAASVPAYLCVVVCGAVLALVSFEAQIVRLEENHRRSVLLSCVPQLGASIGGFCGCVLARSVTGFCVGAAIGVSCATLALRALVGGGWPMTFDARTIRRIVVAAAPFALVALLGWLSGYGTNYLISFMLPSSEVARFTFALSLCSLMLLASGALNQVWCPRFYHLIRAEPFAEVEHKNRSFYRVLAVALGLSGGFVIIAYPWVVPVLGGQLRNYQHMTLELALLFCAYVILVPWWHCQNHFLAHGMGRAILKITLVTSLLGIAALLLLMWRLGPIGVYLGFLVQMLLRTTAIVLEARRHWPVQISLSGVGVGLAMILMGLVLARQPLAPIIPEIGYVLVCAVVLYTFIRNAVLFPQARQAGS